MKKHLYLFLLFAFYNGMTQNILFEEDFSAGFPQGWITDDLELGNGQWTWCINQSPSPSNDCPKIWDDSQNQQGPFSSTTSENGFLVFDSDEYGMEQPNLFHSTYVKSTAFDFSNEDEVWAKFEYQIGVFNQPTLERAFFEVSSDGISWERLQIKSVTTGNNPYPEFVRWSLNPEVIFFDLSSIAAGEAQIFFRWRWFGMSEYYWAIDDFQIYDEDPRSLWLPEKDLEMTRFHAIAANYETPATQVDSFGFFGDLINRSYLDAYNVTFKGSIMHEGEEVFADSIILDTVPANSLIQNQLFPNSFSMFSQPGIYTGIYSVDSGDDDTPFNNKAYFEFKIGDSIFTKESSVDGYTRPSDNQWNQNAHNWAWGNIFYVPKGRGFYANGLSFSFAPDGSFDYESIKNTRLQILLYEWHNLENEIIVFANERTLIGINDYYVTGNETPTGLVYHPFIEDETLMLKDSTYYIAMVRFESQLSAHDIELGTNIQLDYGSTVLRSQQINQPRYASALWIDTNNNTYYDTRGFGYDVVPTVRLHISSVSPTKDISLPDQNFMQIFPNPSTHYFEVSNKGFDFENPHDVQLSIFSLDGKNMGAWSWGNNLQFSNRINISKLPKGMYEILIGTPNQPAIFAKPLLIE